MTGNKSPRTHLDTACTPRVLSKYRICLAELNEEFGHSIVILSDGGGKIERFNCFAYAFGVWGDIRYERLVEKTQGG